MSFYALVRKIILDLSVGSRYNTSASDTCSCQGASREIAMPVADATEIILWNLPRRTRLAIMQRRIDSLALLTNKPAACSIMIAEKFVI